MIGQVGKDSVVIAIRTVNVKIPRPDVPSDPMVSPDMKWCRECRRGPTVIPEHWHHAVGAGNGTVINQNYYGFARGDLGKKMTVTVQVYEKKANSETYINLDYFKEVDGTRPVHMKFLNEPKGEAFPVQGTNVFICFI